MLKNIIFDLGNVLIEWNSDLVYDAYFPSQKAKTQFYTTTRIKELNLELDRGLSFDSGLSGLAARFPEYHEPIWMWKHNWTSMLGNTVSGSVEILEELKAKGYPLYGLTNWAAETFVYAEANLEFLKHFIDIVVSGRELVIKPEPEIYHLLLKRNKLLATECIFIDDNLPNVEAAQALGITAIHFANPQQLRLELESLNIL